MVRLFHAILTGLVGAALLHVVIILALPHFVKADAYRRVEALGPSGRFHPLAGAREAGTLRGLAGDRGALDAGASGNAVREQLVSDDPFMSVAACIVSLENGPVRLYADGDVPFWSVAIYDRNSNEIYSMSDRTAVTGALDILIGTPAALPAIRKALPPDLAQSILVEMPESGGYAVLRALSPTPSYRPDVADFLGGAECGTWKPEASGAAPAEAPADPG
ncbi:DUF1254 domain-containing protein [Gellertiella hungarica]|uniref:Putative membrane protein n=1 Tax=Gellertiella hungarica TaxID=1572859 RepID=A0A7W6J6L2_9HYPH|nr:DUF1254 domain-containing protein [Gellertiella hungarica]MBB4065745.1 putative membrane protein [Gellertiella hungarica]